MIKQIVKNIPDKVRLANYLIQIKAARDWLKNQVESNNIAPLNIALKTDDLLEIQNLTNSILKDFKRVVILGVGGSSLGGKTLGAIAGNSSVKIDFLESIDGNTIARKLDEIDLKNSFFVIISKSGETIETICQTLIVIEKFKENNGDDFSKNFIFITQDKNNKIAQIAEEINAKIYYHPSDIGGRFSYLTIVGLLPAALGGLNLTKIRNGAGNLLNNFLSSNVEDSDIGNICATQLYLFDQGFGSNVVMPYIDSLKDFTDWYRQLWAESLGKNGFGSTPINSMGTVDQHSQLQLYLDGPKDKFFTFITEKTHKIDFNISDVKNCQTRFGGKKLSQIMEIEQNTTIEILEKQNLPIRVLEINELNEESLSALMMQMFLETILIAKVKNINPFDQPAVELRKDLAKKYLDQ
jgi:glucose-6-phosphate isomerase